MSWPLPPPMKTQGESPKIMQIALPPPASPPLVYLAGAIRDDHPEDITWRRDMIDRVGARAIWLNPLAGKHYNPNPPEGQPRWTLHQMVTSGAKLIVAQDLWCVARADVVIFNFDALKVGYPNIGTLIEFGVAVAPSNRPKLIYTIIDPEYTGHANKGMFHLHPFIEINSSIIFPTVDHCIEFCARHFPVLSGMAPHYRGEIPNAPEAKRD